jgi:uncharacterized protein involved in outer membrane biogenesis
LRVKRPHKLLVGIAGTVAATYLVGAALAPFLVNAERFRPQVEAKLQSALGRRVSLGALRFSLWSGPALVAAGVRIGEPVDGSSAGALVVAAGATAAHVAWLPLFRRDVQLRSITIEGLRVTQDGRPLVSDLRVRSRLRIAKDGAVTSSGSVRGALAAFASAPRFEASFAATLVAGVLDLTALDATAGPLRVQATAQALDIFSPAPRVTVLSTARLKQSQGSGRFNLVLAPAEPKATFTLDSKLLDADEIMAAVKLFSGRTGARASAAWLVPEANAGEAGPAIGGPSLARVLEADGSVHADRCVVHGLEMQDLSMRLSLARGRADLDDVTFAAYGGQARGSLSLQPFEPKVPFSLEQSAEGVAIRPLIAALTPAQAGTLDGRASLDIRVNGEAAGAALLPSMNGSGAVAIEDGKIVSVGVIKQVMKSLEVAGAKGIARDETPFDRLSAHFEVVSGTAATKDLEFRSRDLDGDGAGTVGSGGVLHLDLLASFSKEVSDQLVAETHALSIRLGTDGRLSVPLQLRGTIHDPSIQVDLDRVLNEGVLRALKKEGTKSFLKKLLGR